MDEPVNRFPDFVRQMVRRLQTLCPFLDKKKIAQILARAGLHLATTTVGRIRDELGDDEPEETGGEPEPTAPGGAAGEPGTTPHAVEAEQVVPPPESPASAIATRPAPPRVTARGPNDVWHTDLTVVPTLGGFWMPLLPFALPQCWPFCWWVAVVVDHFSRKALGFAVFDKQPTSQQVRQFLGRLIGKAGTAPKYLITDSGVQFTCADFAPWCKRHQIRHRKGAVGHTGSIAIIERFILTMKTGCIRLLSFVPFVQRAFRRELSLFVDWYNQDRAHTSLHGATPDEIYFKLRPKNRAPRFEPRARWPRASPCASPQTLVKGQPGVVIQMKVDYAGGRRHLPRVTLTRAA